LFLVAAAASIANSHAAEMENLLSVTKTLLCPELYPFYAWLLF
jgi:hypothetical protein